MKKGRICLHVRRSQIVPVHVCLRVCIDAALQSFIRKPKYLQSSWLHDTLCFLQAEQDLQWALPAEEEPVHAEAAQLLAAEAAGEERGAPDPAAALAPAVPEERRAGTGCSPADPAWEDTELGCQEEMSLTHGWGGE